MPRSHGVESNHTTGQARGNREASLTPIPHMPSKHVAPLRKTAWRQARNQPVLPMKPQLDVISAEPSELQKRQERRWIYSSVRRQPQA